MIFSTFCNGQKYTTIDSCDCLFMGLNRKQWEVKDKPYWDSIDIKAIKDAGGLYMGDLTSDLCCFTMGRQGSYEVHIYHPSVDLTQIEMHWIIKRKKKK